MTCTRCGKELTTGSVFNLPMCKSCAVKITMKDFIRDGLIPLGISYILYWIAGLVFKGSMNETLLTILLIGFPFGIRRMCMWLVPIGHGVAASLGILLVNVLGGALIGWALLAYTVIATLCKTIYRIIRIVTFRPKPGMIYFD